ncbi:MAG TPA: hypothetical protein VFV34_09090 [Blastocatellia bacterium]|nr:hypothetical protein [Blastocatellia bacterium]
MWKDQIVEETRKVRDEYAARFDYDLNAIARDLQEQQKRSQRQIVSLEPKKPAVPPQVKAS